MLGTGSVADFAIASYARDGIFDVLSVESGALALTGNAASLRPMAKLVVGTLALNGHGFPVYRVIIGPGSLTLSPSSVSANLAMSLDPTTLALLGESSSFAPVQRIDAGYLRLEGGDTPVYRLIVQAGNLLFDGQVFSLVPSISVQIGTLRLLARDLGLRPIGGGGSERKLRKPTHPKSPLKRIERQIEIVGEDGRTKKVPLLQRFAPPPPPPPLELLPSGFGKPLPPELLAPLALPQPETSDLSGETREALELRDIMDAMNAIGSIPDPVAELTEQILREVIRVLHEDQPETI